MSITGLSFSSKLTSTAKPIFEENYIYHIRKNINVFINPLYYEHFLYVHIENSVYEIIKYSKKKSAKLKRMFIVGQSEN